MNVTVCWCVHGLVVGVFSSNSTTVLEECGARRLLAFGKRVAPVPTMVGREVASTAAQWPTCQLLDRGLRVGGLKQGARAPSWATLAARETDLRSDCYKPQKDLGAHCWE